MMGRVQTIVRARDRTTKLGILRRPAMVFRDPCLALPLPRVTQLAVTTEVPGEHGGGAVHGGEGPLIRSFVICHQKHGP